MSEQATHLPCDHSVWSRFTKNGGALLVVGHGTRSAVGASQLIHLVDQMREVDSDLPIEACFLELAQPSIEQTIRCLSDRGVRKIIVVPVLLFAAKHAREDIPQAVRNATREFGIEFAGQTPVLGTHPLAVELSSKRFREVIALQHGQPCPPGICARVHCESGRCEASNKPLGRIGLAMVGRGTSDADAIKQMQSFTELRCQFDHIDLSETGFFAGGNLHVEQLLDIASKWPCDTIVVQPHLLFEGELIEQLRRMVRVRIEATPSRNWLITRTLGADQQLARLWMQLALDEVTAIGYT